MPLDPFELMAEPAETKRLMPYAEPAQVDAMVPGRENRPMIVDAHSGDKGLPTGQPARALQKPNRNRIVSAALLTLVAILGLSSRRFAASLPHAIAAYTGDTAWALAVFLGLGLLFPRLSTCKNAGQTLIISYLVEFSQLYHAPWIDTIRGHSLGHLALGNGFDPKDLVCYTAGVGIAVMIDCCTLRNTSN